MRSMRTLPCRRRGGSTYAYARSTDHGTRDALGARRLQRSQHSVSMARSSTTHADCRGASRRARLGRRRQACPPCRASAGLRSAHHAADARTIVRGAAAAAAARRRTAAVGAGRGTRTARAHGNMSCRMIWSRSGVRWGLGRPRIWNSIGRTGVAD